MTDGLHPAGDGERFIAQTLRDALPAVWAARAAHSRSPVSR